MAVAVDNFLATSSTLKSMDELYDLIKTKYNIKTLERPKRYLRWHFHYKDGGIALSQNFLIDNTLHNTGCK